MILSKTEKKDLKYDEINKINKYAQGDFMVFSDKKFHLKCHLDYVYLVSKDFVSSLKNVKPLTALFSDLHNYNEYMVYRNFAIVTKGRSGKYNVYLDFSPTCMADILGMTTEERNRYKINSRFGHPFNPTPQRELPLVFYNIRPVSDLRDRLDKPKKNIYYQDIKGIYDDYLGKYNYTDSTQRLELEIKKKVIKTYLDADNRYFYFIDKLEVQLKQWKDNKLIFDSSKTSEIYGDIKTILNENHASYGMDFIVYFDRKATIFTQPILKLHLQKEKQHIKFHVKYSYIKNSYRLKPETDMYDFPQFVVFLKEES
ncbi:hypothetical protein [uncultured Kordia sp.]|uniref:hypothetical protein n=1 Tax=uncultured Kordia sp. TaxID=507699 RepID=UPI00262EE2FE|nr:hypothetical protein [uncultured Kordia sp.]